MVPMDLNIGFQGLALIQGQVYNPVIELIFNWKLKLRASGSLIAVGNPFKRN